MEEDSQITVVEPYECKTNDLIETNIWEEWLFYLVKFLNDYENVFNVTDFLGQIKQKVEECSRAYTGMWTLDMLHMTASKHESVISKEYREGLDDLQKRWNDIMKPIREARKELICRKCIELFCDTYNNKYKVLTKKQVDSFKGTYEEQWRDMQKLVHAKEEHKTHYQAFLGKLMTEMTKY